MAKKNAKPTPDPVIQKKLVTVKPHRDGWENIKTALGTTRDKRMYARHITAWVDELTAEEFWRGNALGDKVVSAAIDRMFAPGWGVQISRLTDEKPSAKSPANDPLNAAQLDAEDDEADALKEASEGITTRLEELKLKKVVKRAAKFARAYGGGALLVFTKGAGALNKPLNIEAVGEIEAFVPLLPRELWPVAWEAKTQSADYGQPILYKCRRESSGNGLGTSTFDVHASRIIRFEGVTVSNRVFAENRGWGDSIFTRVLEKIRNFETANEAASSLIEDFAQAIYSMDGLAELVGSDNTDAVRDRVTSLDLMRSVFRAILIDGKDKFERQSTSVAGLSELIDKLANFLSAVTGIPVTVLMGTAPAGLNATGDADVRNWYKQINSDREDFLDEPVNQAVRLVLLERGSATDGVEPARWNVVWPPLWEPTLQEMANERKTQAEVDQIEVNMGAVTPEEIAISRHGGDKWSAQTKLSTRARDVVAAEEAKKAIEAPGSNGAPKPPTA